ncbi:MAG: deoxyribodipyrimidine photolyase [Myxococcota bacterium]
MTAIPAIRLTSCNDAPIREDGEFVLYWMTAFRRLDWNFALQHAVDLAVEHDKSLVILEAIRTDYRWASDRIHQFILDGMAEHAARLADTRVEYFPFVERQKDGGEGLLEALSEHAVSIVTDDYPAFFLPRMVEAASREVHCRLEKVDSNGLIPMYAPEKEYKRAYDLRRWLQKNLPPHLDHLPKQHPLQGHALAPLNSLPGDIPSRWPAATLEELRDADLVSDLPIDHSVPVVDTRPGGPGAAHDVLEAFLDTRLDRYGDRRSHPQADAESQLSPYLHFGHISAHQVFSELMEREGWTVDSLNDYQKGSREGWWNVGENAESFLDELVTWREIGFQTCIHRPNYDEYESLPGWARQTLEEHWDDPREYVYSLDEFEQAKTHDDLWNAAQMQLVTDGKIHNYLRMLWGKKILHWSQNPQVALEIMIELNNKWALDGRDANSYSGIFWTLGRYDRAWQEREIFGKVRYMTCDSTRRKYSVGEYVDTFLPRREQVFG